jgi:hypothetical protein
MGRICRHDSKLIRQTPDNAACHVAQIIKSTRAMLALGGVVEDALDAALEAARQEFQCRIVLLAKARLRIDGHDWEWPL